MTIQVGNSTATLAGSPKYVHGMEFSEYDENLTHDSILKI